MKKKREAPMSPSLLIAIGFALLILLVTLLLMLPISSQSRTVTPPLTALFTATSAVCVTGQVLVDTGTHWSLFGQVVLIAAIQIGGLGVMTLLALVSMAMGRRIGLRQRTILQESVASYRTNLRFVLCVFRLIILLNAFFYLINTYLPNQILY